MSSSGSKFWGVLATLALTGMALGFLAGVLGESRTANNPVMPFLALVGGTAIFLVLLRGPIGQSIGRMLDGHGQSDEQLLGRIDHLEGQVADVGLDQHRMAELEERLDFAERLLAQRADPAALKAPEDR